MNPPGQEFCRQCHAPLTLTADPSLLEDTPEAPDQLRDTEENRDEAPPDGMILAGMGGAPMPVPGETLDPDPDEPPSD
jgi:hypothetical protein